MRKIRRVMSCLLVLLLAVSLCTSAAAAETADERSAVLDWLRESFGLPVSILGKLELTEEQLGALRSIFRTEDGSPEPPEEELTVYSAALKLLDGELGTDEECKARLEAAGLDDPAVQGKTRTQVEKEKRRQRLLQESAKALQNRLAKAEADIAETEDLIARLEARMGEAELYKDPDAAQAVAREHREAQERLDALYEEWEIVAEAAGEN